MNYDDIRPYNDVEVAEAMHRIADAPEIATISDALSGPGHVQELRDALKRIDSTFDFQAKIMANAIRVILDKTSRGVEVIGSDRLADGKKHVFVSNHRDIILDPAILQLVLFDQNLPTTEIAVGDNLIANCFIEDVFRSNGMIKVERGGTPRQKYVSSVRLSEYIRDRIVSGASSVWIAQRNGRSKDGLDATGQGVLKMFDMSGSGHFVDDFMQLSIVPISISYQYEPCDFLKAREVYISKREKYVKRPGEDTESILVGFTQPKGHIAYSFSEELTREELQECAVSEKNERFQDLAALLDRKICGNYKLWNTNYIAYDILNGEGSAWKAVQAAPGNAGANLMPGYTVDEKNEFTEYMEKGLEAVVKDESGINPDEMREIFLLIYANPVRSFCEKRQTR